jgi:hypothetical protein
MVGRVRQKVNWKSALAPIKAAAVHETLPMPPCPPMNLRSVDDDVRAPLNGRHAWQTRQSPKGYSTREQWRRPPRGNMLMSGLPNVLGMILVLSRMADKFWSFDLQT